MYWAGIKVDNHFCSDIESYAIELYKLRFPDSVQLGDITKIDFKKLKKDFPGEWIITGGFPCQDISVAGKGKGLIDEKGNKTRSGLWFDYKEAIRILRPRFAVIENVRALLNRGLATVLSDLAEIGYNAEWQIISAADMDAPHKRERIWIFAYSDSTFSQRKRESGGHEKKNAGVGSYSKMGNTKSTGQSSRNNGQGKMQFRGTSTWNRKRQEEWWAVEPDVGRLANGVSNRVDRLKGLGNAIVPQISELLFNQIKEYL
jgi:DNA (cytosine-5)-methyltransferase 1